MAGLSGNIKIARQKITQSHAAAITAKSSGVTSRIGGTLGHDWQAGLFLIVFALQIANDRQRIFFSDIQSLAQIINFFTFVTGDHTIAKRR